MNKQRFLVLICSAIFLPQFLSGLQTEQTAESRSIENRASNFLSFLQNIEVFWTRTRTSSIDAASIATMSGWNSRDTAFMAPFCVSFRDLGNGYFAKVRRPVARVGSQQWKVFFEDLAVFSAEDKCLFVSCTNNMMLVFNRNEFDFSRFSRRTVFPMDWFDYLALNPPDRIGEFGKGLRLQLVEEDCTGVPKLFENKLKITNDDSEWIFFYENSVAGFPTSMTRTDTDGRLESCGNVVELVTMKLADGKQCVLPKLIEIKHYALPGSKGVPATEPIVLEKFEARFTHTEKPFPDFTYKDYLRSGGEWHMVKSYPQCWQGLAEFVSWFVH